MLSLVLAAAAAAASPTGGQASAVKPPVASAPTAQQQFDALAQQLKAHGVSEDGIRKVIGSAKTGVAAARPLLQRLAQANDGLRRAGTAEPFSGAAFEAALRQQQSVAFALNKLRFDSQLGMFHALNPADQKVMARITVQSAPVR